MSFGVCGFTVPKRGSSAAENQDAHFPRLFPTWKSSISEKRREIQTEEIVVGLADGATEGILSGVWANLLLKAVGLLIKNDENLLDFETVATNATRLWAKFKRRRSKGNTQPITQLPFWLEEEALSRGAYSTLCVGLFEENHRWRAVSVGDSCMFQVRGDSMIRACPALEPEEFGNSPYLISSEPCFNGELNANTKCFWGDWEPADRFFFATDALACWFLQQERQGKRPWHQLANFDPEAEPAAFREFVEEKRAIDEMRNDDVTLLRLYFVPAETELAHATSFTSRV